MGEYVNDEVLGKDYQGIEKDWDEDPCVDCDLWLSDDCYDCTFYKGD